MQGPAAVARWLAGWVELTRHDAVPGYAGRSRLQRFGLDLAALAVALASAGTWFAVLVALAAGLAGCILAWHFDLAGWQRDAALCLPVLILAPWAAAGRRRHIEALLARRTGAPGSASTS